MKNILKNLLGDRAYKQLLKLVGSGGGNDGASVIKLNFYEGFPFAEEDTMKLYTSLVYNEEVSESDIQYYQGLINDNIKFANSVIQNFNSNKGTFLNIEAIDGRGIVSVDLLQNGEFITITDTNRLAFLIPVSLSLDGKVILRDYPYTVTGK